MYKYLISVLFPPPVFRFAHCGLPRHGVLKRELKIPLSPCTMTFFYNLCTETLLAKKMLIKKCYFCVIRKLPLLRRSWKNWALPHRLWRCHTFLGWRAADIQEASEFDSSYCTVLRLCTASWWTPRHVIACWGTQPVSDSHDRPPLCVHVAAAKYHFSQMIAHLREVYVHRDFSQEWQSLLVAGSHTACMPSKALLLEGIFR